MDVQKTTTRLDNIGMTASTICAVHCALVPVLLTSLPLLGLGFLANKWVEWGMMMLALLIGAASIGLGYKRTHRRMRPLVLLVLGFGLIILGHLPGIGWAEAALVPLGGLTIATAHFINFKYTGHCRHNVK